MSYLSRRLAPGEEIVAQGEYHWFQKTWPWLALVVLGILIVGIVIWAVALIRMATTDWAVTSRRIILKRGIISVNVSELTLGSVEGAEVHQSIFGRIFGYGKLHVTGRGDTELEFPTMAHPNRFRSAIESARMAMEAKPVEVIEHPTGAETPAERQQRLTGKHARRQRHAH